MVRWTVGQCMVYRHWQRVASPLLTCPFKEADHHHLADDQFTSFSGIFLGILSVLVDLAAETVLVVLAEAQFEINIGPSGDP